MSTDTSIAGFVKLLKLRRSSGELVSLPGPTYPLGGPLCACYVGPTRASFQPLLAVGERRQQMPTRLEVLGHGSIRRQKARGMTG